MVKGNPGFVGFLVILEVEGSPDKILGRYRYEDVARALKRYERAVGEAARTYQKDGLSRIVMLHQSLCSRIF
jgi:hypothetical protein